MTKMGKRVLDKINKMDTNQLTKTVKEEFERLTSNYEGKKFKGTFRIDNFECFTLDIILNSSIYTQRVGECIPDIKPHDGARNPLPKGTFFRAEVATKPSDQTKYLAALIESTGQAYLFTAHLETNDPDYVKTHGHISWKEE